VAIRLHMHGLYRKSPAAATASAVLHCTAVRRRLFGMTQAIAVVSRWPCRTRVNFFAVFATPADSSNAHAFQLDRIAGGWPTGVEPHDTL